MTWEMENNRERERMDCEVIEKSWKKYESWMIGRAKSEERIPMNLFSLSCCFWRMNLGCFEEIEKEMDGIFMNISCDKREKGEIGYLYDYIT